MGGGEEGLSSGMGVMPFLRVLKAMYRKHHNKKEGNENVPKINVVTLCLSNPTAEVS